MQITAAVVREKFARYELDTFELDDPRADEILVKVVASGICQTDVHGRDGYFQIPYPAVFGHEGAGVVEAVGSGVTTLKPGDHVIMSFPWCGGCPSCRASRIAYCQDAGKLKQDGTRADGSTLLKQNGQPIYGSFFQQSSFSTYTIANERYAIKVRPDAPIALLGPLACGGQTGAGAVMNVMQPKPGDSIAVFGTGGVGLSGLMAARILGCDPIIAVDIRPERLALAKELGATHVINASDEKDVVGAIQKITGGGANFTLETSAVPAVFRMAEESTLQGGGTCVLVGSARKGTDVSFEMPHIQRGRIIRGVVQGESTPKSFIPKLIDHVMAGEMPIEKMIRRYAFADINQAVADAESGVTIKPVLDMPH